MLNESSSEESSSESSEDSSSESSEDESTSNESTIETEPPIAVPHPKQKQQRWGKNDAKVTEDNFDELLASLPAHSQLSSPSPVPLNDPLSEALKVDPDWLDAGVELRKKFGGAAISGGNSAMTQINSRIHRGKALPKRKPFRRKGGFITPRPQWPPFGPAEVELSVQECAPQGYFEIVESQRYQDMVQELTLMIQSGDLEFLMQLIQACPLFVDGLLLLSDAYRMQSTGDAGEIVERAMYILERILPTSDAFESGHFRFPYAASGNRKLHLCLFRLIQYTIKAGCWRVALQMSKALLQLDPVEDALGARLFIDFLALQGGQFEKFEALNAVLPMHCTYAELPSWPFSHALSAFMKSGEGRDLLLEACVKYPGTARFLAQSMKVTLPSGFESKFASQLAAFDSDLTSVAVTKIYVARCGMLWRGLEVVAWFRSTLNGVNFDEMANTSKSSPSTPMKATVGIFRHALLSDLPALNVAFPRDLSSHLNSFDPCPPEFFEDEQSGTITGLLNSIRGLMF